MILHALQHHGAGYPLPTIWLGVRDTLANHKLTTHKTLQSDAWREASNGAAQWRIGESGHRAVFTIQDAPIVQLEMIGADSAADADKVRTECHGVWFDEAAPAMGMSNGLSDTIWYQAMSSQRLPTHARVGVLTTNAPDEEHWTWARFHTSHPEGTLKYQIPAGERASPEYRAELDRLYATRPDLHRRLVLGLPGVVLLGQPVAVGFREDLHVTRHTLPVERGAPLWAGIDGGESHCWATVICQRVGGRIHVLAGLCDEETGCRQHMQQTVLPWLEERAPWVFAGPWTGISERVQVRYDPACDVSDPGDRESNPLRILRRFLPGQYRAGAREWAGRRDPLLGALGQLRGGGAYVQVDPSCVGLIRALRGGWHYETRLVGGVKSDRPKKPNHPHEDYGDAFAYAVAGMSPAGGERPVLKPYRAQAEWNPVTYGVSQPRWKFWGRGG